MSSSRPWRPARQLLGASGLPRPPRWPRLPVHQQPPSSLLPPPLPGGSCWTRPVVPGFRPTPLRPASSGPARTFSSPEDTAPPATARSALPDPPESRASSGGRHSAADGDPPPSPARAGEWQCRPARTVQAAGDSDRGPAPSVPPPSLVRARDRQCHPARTVPRPVDGPPLADSDRAAGSGARPPTHARRHGRGSRRDLATLQSTGPLADLGGKRPTCKGHTPTYSLYTVSGH